MNWKPIRNVFPVAETLLSDWKSKRSQFSQPGNVFILRNFARKPGTHIAPLNCCKRTCKSDFEVIRVKQLIERVLYNSRCIRDKELLG